MELAFEWPAGWLALQIRGRGCDKHLPLGSFRNEVTMVHISLGSIPLTLGNTLLWPGCTLIGFLLSALGHAQVTTALVFLRSSMVW